VSSLLEKRSNSLLKNRLFLRKGFELERRTMPYSSSSPYFLSDRLHFPASLSVPGALNSRQTLQIEEPSDHERLLPDVLKHPSEESPESMLFFGFSPQLFDLFPRSLTQLVKDPSLPHPDPRMFFIGSDLFGGDVGLDLSFEETPDKLLLKESLVGSDTLGLEFKSFLGAGDQFQNPTSFSGRSLRSFNIDADQDPVSVLHDGVDGISGNRGFFGGLRGEPRVGVGSRAVSLVGARLSAPVDGWISRVVVFSDLNRLFFWLRIAADSFLVFFRRLIHFDRLKTLVRSIRPDGGAVHAPVTRDQSFFHGDFYRVIKDC